MDKWLDQICSCKSWVYVFTCLHLEWELGYGLEHEPRWKVHALIGEALKDSFINNELPCDTQPFHVFNRDMIPLGDIYPALLKISKLLCFIILFGVGPFGMQGTVNASFMFPTDTWGILFPSLSFLKRLTLFTKTLLFTTGIPKWRFHPLKIADSLHNSE